MGKLGRFLGIFAVLAGFAGIANAAPVYVGSWHVGDGPQWDTNPAVYTGQEAAALLFGGVASDYAISTVSANIADINYMAFVDGWADSQYLTTPVAQDFSLVTGTGYNDPGGFQTAYSAYVLDHSCTNRYDNLSQACAVVDTSINYAFYVGPQGQAVPEPATLALFGLGLAGLGLVRRRW